MFTSDRKRVASALLLLLLLELDLDLGLRHVTSAALDTETGANGTGSGKAKHEPDPSSLTYLADRNATGVFDDYEADDRAPCPVKNDSFVVLAPEDNTGLDPKKKVYFTVRLKWAPGLSIKFKVLEKGSLYLEDSWQSDGVCGELKTKTFEISNHGHNPGNPGIHGNSENPGIPGNPENPGIPGNPGNPGILGNPGNPGIPENPGNPGIPENPGNPGIPGNPGNPGDEGESLSHIPELTVFVSIGTAPAVGSEHCLNRLCKTYALSYDFLPSPKKIKLHHSPENIRAGGKGTVHCSNKDGNPVAKPFAIRVLDHKTAKPILIANITKLIMESSLAGKYQCMVLSHAFGKQTIVVSDMALDVLGFFSRGEESKTRAPVLPGESTTTRSETETTPLSTSFAIGPYPDEVLIEKARQNNSLDARVQKIERPARESSKSRGSISSGMDAQLIALSLLVLLLV